MSENVPVLRRTQDIALLTDQQLALLKKTYAPTATDEEFAFYLQVAQAADLNPFTQPPEIYLFKIKGKLVMPVGIDGLRRKAAESGDYAGQVGPQWCGEDGEWKDIWLPKEAKERPVACRVGVLRYMPNGEVNPNPTWGIAKASEFAKDTAFWRDRFCHMLSIRAEGHAFRKGCPGLTKKMQAAGAQVIDAEYLIAKAEQIERQVALPRHTPPGDLQQELYGDRQVINGEFEEGEEPGEPESEAPVEWTKADLARFQQAVADRELSSHEWRQLLGLAVTAQKTELVALGPVGKVIDLLQAAFTQAIAGESENRQGKLGF